MPTLKDLIDTLPQQGRVEWIGVRPARKAPVEAVAQAALEAEAEERTQALGLSLTESLEGPMGALEEALRHTERRTAGAAERIMRAINEPVGALAFINIDSREVGYDGAGNGFSSGRRRIAADDWAETLAGWRREVEGLLLRFADGEIGINILQSADDARPLALLSRVEELRRGD